ncbi:hypothetical protein XELAEV_18012145mg, partial [Xenopus laevis]
FNSSSESHLENIISRYCHAAEIGYRQQESGIEYNKKRTAERECTCPYIHSMAQCCWPVICVLILTEFAVASYLTSLIIVQRQQKLGHRTHTN